MVELNFLAVMSSPRIVIGDPQIKEYGFPIKLALERLYRVALGNDNTEVALSEGRRRVVGGVIKCHERDS